MTTIAAAGLAVHAYQAEEAQRIQLEASQAGANLAATLTELQIRTRDDLEDINTTATAIREELLGINRDSMSHLGPAWWAESLSYGTMWMFRMVFKGECLGA